MSLKSKNSKFNFGKQKYRKKSKCTYRRCLVSFEAFYEQWFLHLDSRGSCELGKKPFSYYRSKITIRADNYAFQPKLQFSWRTTKSQLLWTAIGIIHLKRDVTISTKKTHPSGVVLDTNDHFDGRCLEGEMSKNLWMFDSQHPNSGIIKKNHIENLIKKYPSSSN